MRKFKEGDTVIPNRVLIDDGGHKIDMGDWCDYNHKYRILTVGSRDLSYKLEGITNGRSSFYLGEPFFIRNYKLEDDKCGRCSSKCRSEEGKCPFYTEVMT